MKCSKCDDREVTPLQGMGRPRTLCDDCAVRRIAQRDWGRAKRAGETLPYKERRTFEPPVVEFEATLDEDHCVGPCFCHRDYLTLPL